MKKQNTLFAAMLIGVIVFLWFATSVISDLNSWNAWDQPAEFAKMIKAVVFGLIAFAAAVGIDIKPVLAQFIPALASKVPNVDVNVPDNADANAKSDTIAKT